MVFQLTLALNLLSWQHRKLQTLVLGALASRLLFWIAPGNGRGNGKLRAKFPEAETLPAGLYSRLLAKIGGAVTEQKPQRKFFQLLLRFRT